MAWLYKRGSKANITKTVAPQHVSDNHSAYEQERSAVIQRGCYKLLASLQMHALSEQSIAGLVLGPIKVQYHKMFWVVISTILH